MILIGLTGGVGMGKSTVAGFFSQHGLPLVDSDVLARELVEPGQPALAEIAAAFGAGMIGPDGRLRREDLARAVFPHPERRKQLESILHPRIRQAWRARAEKWRVAGLARGLAVVPLLYEAGLAADFDVVVCVACSTDTQMERLAARGWSAAQSHERIQAQWPVEKKAALARFVIWSEGALDVTALQVARLLPFLA